MRRKDVLRRLNGLAPRVEEHLDKISADPSGRDVPHWRSEVESWVRQVEEMLSHVGAKTAKEWARRIDGWRRRLGA
jgi:hypothetical protein